ncbi:MAG: HIT domain-containing protein [Anaerolineae bacterium]|nr:HIT domain-containing protein [Anaerolineae bacterium]
MTLLFRLARHPAAGWLIAFVLARAAFLLPVNRLYETGTLLAFYHPRPSYPLHILLVPRRRLATLTALGPQDTAFLQDLIIAVRYLVLAFDLESHGYRLIANGGPYQDVPHLHFHLISETAPASSP